MRENQSRQAQPEDYDVIAAVVDEWWGRPVLASLPRLFLDHFHRSSLVIDGPAGMMAFLIGFLSPSLPERAYIHFVGVAPDARGCGLGRGLYEEFFTLARTNGRRIVSAATAPAMITPSASTSRWASPSLGPSRTTTVMTGNW